MAAILRPVSILSRQLNCSRFEQLCLNRVVLSRKEFTRHYSKSLNGFHHLHPCHTNLINFGTTYTRRLNSQNLCLTYTVRNNSSSAPGGPEDIPAFIGNEIVSTNADSILNTDSIINTIDYIPEPPPIPIPLDIVESLQLVGEPSFVSLGLGHWTPVGLVELSLEYFHTTLGIPWWLSIVLGTLIIRTAMFPIMIKTQRSSAKVNNNLPKMQQLQQKITEARNSGNNMDTAKYSRELMLFMKERGLNPVVNMMWPLAQGPVFISFFFALRNMANLPVQSLNNGGLWWFSNLVIPDPFYILPIVTSITLFITLEMAADGGLRTGNMKGMRNVLRALPIVILPFTASFPAAVLCYWATSNILSLGIASVLKIPLVREKFKIDKLIIHSKEDFPVNKKGVVASFKESISNTRVASEMEDRHRVAALKFRQAGMGPIEKTYPYDPTKQLSPPSKGKSL